MTKFLSALFIFFILIFPIWSIEAAPDLIASSAILYDYTTGRVLYEKEADEIIAPASMTKLISLYLGWQYLEEGRISRSDLVDITAEGSSFSRPPGSSLMLLEEGQRVTFLDLLKGLAISSGNDAAYALAHEISGSAQVFVKEMNQLVQSKGYSSMYFSDPDGWSDENRITAREYAAFSADYIRTFPDALEEIHSQEYFVYPKEENLPPLGGRILTPRNKKNTNILLGEVEGVDGLKTGYIDESGFNFTATAKRNDSRFIAVVLGIKNVPYFEGIEIRAEEAKDLLEFGFRNYKTIYPEIPQIDELILWEGEEDFLPVQMVGSPVYTLSIDEMPRFTSVLTLPDEVTAPVSEGDILGYVQYKTDGGELDAFPIVASETVEKGSLFKVLWHRVKKLYTNLILQ
ncbi:MAG: D-alanyl-D-alanine carboxypeptidase [Spirochaetaceae bacterium]|nr:D-alanyl-D-alanine carboxypeptidase [Spirochaetaceae bacterium]